MVLAMEPPRTTAQQKGVRVVGGRAMHYTKDKVTRARTEYAVHLKPHVPKVPFTGPCEARVRWYFPSKREKDNAYKVTRPDLDNMEKLLFDTLTSLGFMNDDAQIAKKHTEKRWTRGPGRVEVDLIELAEEA